MISALHKLSAAIASGPVLGPSWVRTAAMAGVALLATCPSWAAEPRNITAGELALTPDFCQDVQTINGWSQHGNESPRSPYWISIFGKTFWGMHHYCWAAVNIHRSKAAGLSKQDRDFMIQSAIADHYYVVNIAPRNFILLPEIYFLVGEAHVMLGEYVQAIDAFQKSRAAKPDYWPPYEGYAKVLEKLGKKAEARALLESGLEIMPGEPRLLQPLLRLGGKAPPPRPRPVPEPPVEAAASAASAAAPEAVASAAAP